MLRVNDCVTTVAIGNIGGVFAAVTQWKCRSKIGKGSLWNLPVVSEKLRALVSVEFLRKTKGVLKSAG